jgi:hypothetical protein
VRATQSDRSLSQKERAGENMRILLDHGTPAPLRQKLTGHSISTAYEMGCAQLDNGTLPKAADGSFDIFITTDQNLRYQQNLVGRKLAILVQDAICKLGPIQPILSG